jgi:hypothetical protein
MFSVIGRQGCWRLLAALTKSSSRLSTGYRRYAMARDVMSARAAGAVDLNDRDDGLLI